MACSDLEDLTKFLTAGFKSVRRSGRRHVGNDDNDSRRRHAEARQCRYGHAAMKGDCKACLKDAGGSDNPMHCPPSCIAPVLAVLPQGLNMTAAPRLKQPSVLSTPFLQGRSSLPDPCPPRPSYLS